MRTVSTYTFTWPCAYSTCVCLRTMLYHVNYYCVLQKKKKKDTCEGKKVNKELQTPLYFHRYKNCSGQVQATKITTSSRKCLIQKDTTPSTQFFFACRPLVLNSFTRMNYMIELQINKYSYQSSTDKYARERTN